VDQNLEFISLQRLFTEKRTFISNNYDNIRKIIIDNSNTVLDFGARGQDNIIKLWSKLCIMVFAPS
jgi:hypothetical protein